MSQTSYEIESPVAFNGMLADTTQHKDVLSLNNKAGAVFVGCVVTKGAADDEIVHPDAAGEITDVKLVKGVVLHSHDLESQGDGLEPNVPRYKAVNVLHKGRMWVKFEDAPSTTVQPSVRYAGVGQLGAFVSTPVLNETALLPNSKVLAVAAGNLALIEIDL